MSGPVDWPLALGLMVVFVVMSLFRWRYFQSLARRRDAAKRKREAPPAP